MFGGRGFPGGFFGGGMEREGNTINKLYILMKLIYF